MPWVRPYDYRELHARQIRLIRLVQPALQFTSLDQVSTTLQEIEIEHVLLDDPPDYEAVSYTWDGQTCDLAVMCGGDNLMTTWNCLRLLDRLKNRACKRFWIDAICIDQSSNNSTREKNLQLPLMGEIFQRASQVVVWLGEATHESDKAFEFWSDLDSFFLPYLTQPAFIEDMMGRKAVQTLPADVMRQVNERRAQFAAANEKHYGRTGTAECNLMSEVLQRNWFRRAWTVQELVMGCNPVMLCGRSEILWGTLVSVLTRLALFEQMESTEHINETKLLTRIAIHSNLRKQIQPHLRALRPTNVDVSMTGMLTQSMSLCSADPRDKVYALYGMLLALNSTPLPTVNYDDSITDVYQAASRAATELDRSLDLLYHIGGKRATPGLPSWVADLNGQPAPLIQYRHCTASRDSKPIFLFVDDRTLFVSGRVIDKIETRAKLTLSLPYELAARRHASLEIKISEALPHLKRQVQAFEELVEMGTKPSNLYPTPFDAINSFRNTILQGYFMDNHLDKRIGEKELEAFESWCNILLAYSPDMSEFTQSVRQQIDEVARVVAQRPAIRALYLSGDVDPQIVTKTREWKVLMALNYTLARLIHPWILAKTAWHTFFYTGGGNMGMGTDQIQDGDKVVVVSGLKVPLIVRPADDGILRVVGPAFIDGMMNGEAWSEHEVVDIELL